MEKLKNIERPRNAILAASFLSCIFLLFPISKLFAQEKIIINELQIAGEKSTDDFIELYNPDPSPLNLSGYSLMKKTASSATDYTIISWTEDEFVPAKGFYVWAHNDPNDSTDNFSSFIQANASTTAIISPDNGIALRDPSGETIDSVGWGKNYKNIFVETNPFIPSPEAGKSIGRTLFQDTDNNELDFNIFDQPTPGKSNLQEEPEDEPDPGSQEDPILPIEEYSDQIRLNEILPNPEGDEASEEYIEIYNNSSSHINLENWELKDASTTKFTFPAGPMIGAGEYLALYRSAFKFALNNTGQETIFLSDPNGNIVSETSYENAPEGSSFSFDGSEWKWTKRLTPEQANAFDPIEEIRAEEIEEGYVNMPIDFSLDPDYDNFSKITWDFGDGKKSYLKSPTHTYSEKGEYEVTVSATEEDASDSFILEIKSYPKTKLEIITLLPNPAGTDSGQEWIEIRNNGKDPVNLKGWKVATGQSTLTNHPIKDDFEIGPGDAEQLTRENSYFTLNNRSMKLELRYPDGKTADKVSYSKDSIRDDEIYSKEDGRWIWIAPEETEEIIPENQEEDSSENISENTTALSTIETSDSLEEHLKEMALEEITLDPAGAIGKFSPSPDWEEKKRNKLLYLAYGLDIEGAPNLAKSNIFVKDNSFPLTTNRGNNLLLKINYLLNKLFR